MVFNINANNECQVGKYMNIWSLHFIKEYKHPSISLDFLFFLSFSVTSPPSHRSKLL